VPIKAARQYQIDDVQAARGQDADAGEAT
jgi:pyruvate dehydrogenase E1 component